MGNFHVKNWCKDRPPFVQTAVHAVLSANVLVGLIDKSRDFNSGISYFQNISPKEWVKLYKKHRRVNQAMAKLIFMANRENMTDATNLAENAPQLLMNMRKMSPEQAAPYLPMMQHLMTCDTDSLANDGPIGKIFASMLNFDDTACGSKRIDANEVMSPELLFFLLVWTPCWFEHDMHLTLLYRDARKGKQKSLEKLLRLDKRILADSAISKHIAAAVNIQGRDYGDLVKAIDKPIQNPGSKELRRQVKIWAGANVLYTSKLTCEKLHDFESRTGYQVPEPMRHWLQPLQYKEILALYDAVAKDATGEDDAQDGDFADIDPAAFKKRLQRAVDGWEYYIPKTINGYAIL